jgi:hypothetical protein
MGYNTEGFSAANMERIVFGASILEKDVSWLKIWKEIVSSCCQIWKENE